jgi:hypothetical protein
VLTRFHPATVRVGAPNTGAAPRADAGKCSTLTLRCALGGCNGSRQRGRGTRVPARHEAQPERSLTRKKTLRW